MRVATGLAATALLGFAFAGCESGGSGDQAGKVALVDLERIARALEHESVSTAERARGEQAGAEGYGPTGPNGDAGSGSG